jgi:hypothetical protein
VAKSVTIVRRAAALNTVHAKRAVATNSAGNPAGINAATTVESRGR